MKPYLSLFLRSLKCGLWAAAFTINCGLWADNLENPPISACSGSSWKLLQWLSADYETDEDVVRDAEGIVSQWKDRSSKAKHMEQLDALKRPSFIDRATHPSGLGTVVYGDDYRVLTGGAVIADAMEDITIIAVWRPRLLQNAILWQQGNLSIQLRDNGTYGLAIDGILEPEVHSYRAHEHIVSILWIDRSGLDGASTAHFYHNTRATSVPLDLGIFTINDTALTALGGDATAGYFKGEIQELVLYNNCVSLSQVDYFTNLFSDAYNLSLDSDGDGVPDDFDGDASWDGIPNWWLVKEGQNPYDPGIAGAPSDMAGLTWWEKFQIGNGLKGHWRLLARDDRIAEDISGFKNDGVFSASGVDWTSGGYGVNLDGTGEIAVGDPADGSLDLGQRSITMSVWFRTTDVGWKSFFSKGTYGYEAGYGLGLVGATGRVFATLGGSEGKLHIRTVNEFNDGEWHHAVAVFDRDEEKAWLYIDGVRQQITNVHDGVIVNGDTLDFTGVTGPTATSARNLYMGAMANFTNAPVYRVIGSLAEIRLYDRALSQSDIDLLRSIDTSANGIPDWWEVQYFGRLGVDRWDDSDGDRFPLLFEYAHGTDPTDPASYPTPIYIVDPALPESGAHPDLLSAFIAAEADAQVYPIIEVAPGTYSGLNNSLIQMVGDTGTLLISKAGSDQTIIDGAGNLGARISLSDRSGMVGFTLSNIDYGIDVEGGTYLADLRLSKSGASIGHSFYAAPGAQVLIRGCAFFENDVGSLVLDGAEASILQTLFAHNATDRAPVVHAEWGAQLYIENCVFLRNASPGNQVIELLGGVTVDVVNCTFFRNEAKSMVGGSEGASAAVLNSILWNEWSPQELDPNGLAGLEVGFSLIRRGYNGNGNFSDAPELTAAGFLTSASPARDSGIASLAPAVDFHDQARPWGQGVDIGADEFTDADANGLADWWELLYFGALGTAPSGDLDGDGGSNLDEFVGGTDPSDAFDSGQRTVVLVDGDRQVGSPGTFLARPVRVAVVDRSGTPLPGLPIFVESDSALLSDQPDPLTASPDFSASTDASGMAEFHVLP